MSLVELQQEYRHARARTDKAAKFKPADCPREVCRYCGRWWRIWKGSKLDGHAACIVDERFKFLVRTKLSNPRVTYRDVGLAIGVSASVIRSWTFPIRHVTIKK